VQTTLFKVVDKMKPTGTKPFSRKDYNKFRVYEKLLMDHVEIPNHDLVHNSDPHGIDILVMKDGVKVGALEAESHGKYWTKTKFPFKTCHFLYRKKKYIDSDHFYVMMNRKAKTALMLPFKDLIRYKTKVMTNVKVRNEKFYDVPVRNCIVGWKDINDYLDMYFNFPQIMG